MHILITDSGVGGLSVVAYAERFVSTRGFTEPVRLTFANAAPENDYGYNSMPTREAKVETFDRFLRNVTERFAPDSIYVDGEAGCATVAAGGSVFRLTGGSLVLLRPCAHCGTGQFASPPVERLADLGYALAEWQPLHDECRQADPADWL